MKLRVSGFRTWPLSWRAPLLAAGLLVSIAMIVSQVVLSRLASDQEANLRSLSEAYLDGLSAAVVQPVVRGDIWETFDALDRARDHYSGVASKFVIVESVDGRVLASSEPLRFAARTALQDTVARQFPVVDGMVLSADSSSAWLSRSLKIEGHPVGKVLAEIDIAALLSVRRQVFLTLVTVNAAITIALSTFAYLALRRMLRPLGTLMHYVERVRQGPAEPIPNDDHFQMSTEFRRLFDRFNAMALAVNEREQLAARLLAQEKLAVLGKLASGMAHEVNNPLGGIFNALDTLQRHGADSEVREATISLLRRGVLHIRNVVRSTLVTYKSGDAIDVLAPSDIDDLRLLVEPEVTRKHLTLEWRNELDTNAPVSAGSVRQATLNLLLNACAATPFSAKVRLLSKIEGDVVVVEIGDTGGGLAPKFADYLMDNPGAPSVPDEGLGLWIVRRLVSDEGGSISVSSDVAGTMIRVIWPFKFVVASDVVGGAAVGEELAHAE